MKRSDMVEIIKGAVNGSLSFKSDLAMASYILRAAEDHGMLPPENPNLSQEVIDDGLSGNYWEPEDES